MRRLRLFPLALLLTSTAFAQDARVVTTVSTDVNPAWKSWRAHDCSMNYPGAWTMDSTQGNGTYVLFKGPAKSTVPVQVKVGVVELDGRTPAQFHDMYGPKQVAKSMADVKMVATTGPDDSGAYTMDYLGTDGADKLHKLEEVSFHAGKAYILTYSAAPADYDEQLFMAEAMLNSFACPASK